MSGLNLNVNSYHGWNSSSIQTLFSGFRTTGVSNLASLTSDYSSIRNGSYGKLVKAYYDKIDTDATKTKKSSVNKAADLAKNDTKVKTTTKEENQVASDSKSLENSIEKLQKTGASSVFSKSYSNKTSSYDYDTEKIYGAVNDFVKSYNSLLDSTDKLDSSSTDSKVSSMLKATRNNSKLLEKVGITAGTDSKLSINKDTFAKSDMKDVMSLFQGSGSYGSSVYNQASSIASGITGKSTYNSQGKFDNNVKNDLFSSYI